MSWSPVPHQAVPPLDRTRGLGDEVVATPGSLRIRERRSWPTWALVAGALVAGAVGGVIGYLPARSAPTSSTSNGPAFPSVRAHSPATGATTRAPSTSRPATSVPGRSPTSR